VRPRFSVRHAAAQRPETKTGAGAVVLSQVGKLLSEELALESALTCMACLGVLRTPVLLDPCGHAFCRQCAKLPGACAECGSTSRSVVAAWALDTLASKFQLRVGQLQDLQRALV